MTPTRLLAAFVLLCSVCVLAQDDQQKNTPLAGQTELSAAMQNAGSASEPWKIVPDGSSTAGIPQDPLARLEASQPPLYRNQPPASKAFFFPSPGSRGFHNYPDVLADNDTCYAIRSYVVARDSKGSDSTHLVRYSTCQPAKQYQLRTTVLSPNNETVP